MIGSFLVSILSIMLGMYLVWYFTGAITDDWRLRRKRRAYRKMMAVKPYGKRYAHRRSPQARQRKRN